MRSYQIQDNRDFMKKLLMTDTFDTFLLSEAAITTYASFHIDGSFHPEYLSSSEAEQLGAEKSGYALWRRVRPFFFDLVKGKNTPLNFRIVFRLADYNTEKLLAQSGVALQPQDVSGLFLNIYYNGKNVSCTTGASLNIFSLDKSLEYAWDSMVQKFLQKKQIPFTSA